jgi:hypothetical protein
MLVGESNPSTTSSTASVSSCNIGPSSGPHTIMVGLVDMKKSTTAMLATAAAAADTIIESIILMLISKSNFVPDTVKQPALYVRPSYGMQR